jgi:hypothetical protein
MARFVKWSEGGVRLHSDLLTRFIEIVESGISNEHKEFMTATDKSAETMTEEERDEYFDFMSDENWILSKVVPNHARRAIFLTVFGWIEHSVAHICRAAYRQSLTTEKPQKTLYLQDSKDYLISNNLVAAAFFDADWDFLDEARVLRNFVAHNDAKIQPSGTPNVNRAKAFISGRPDIRIDTIDQLEIDSDFCFEVLNVGKKKILDAIAVVDALTPETTIP